MRVPSIAFQKTDLTCKSIDADQYLVWARVLVLETVHPCQRERQPGNQDAAAGYPNYFIPHSAAMIRVDLAFLKQQSLI
jgi:hypothetical protein